MDIPPSILLIVSDDHAAWALHDNPLGVPTPNLDRLRDEGVCYTNAFTPSPVCSPARACLMTGKMPSEVGIHDWLDESDPEVAARNWLQDIPTLPRQLRERGYQTCLSGKWHLGDPGANPPGFDHAFTMSPRMRTHGGEDTYYLNGTRQTLEGNRSRLITDQALSFLEQTNPDHPFFLNVGYFATHSPYVDTAHDPESVAPFRNHTFPDMPRGAAHPEAHNENGPHPEQDPEQERQKRWRGYAAGVAEIDREVGRLLQALDHAGRLENTLVVYTADHGCCLGQHGIWGKGNGTRPVNFTDTSLRVPLLIRGPGFNNGTEREDLWTHLDTHQLILRVAERSVPKTRPGHHAIFAEYGDARMIRTPDWKWIRRENPPRNELYHLAEDPEENVNLAGMPDLTSIRKRLDTQLQQYFQCHATPEHDGLRVGEQPIHNPYEPWNHQRSLTGAPL